MNKAQKFKFCNHRQETQLGTSQTQYANRHSTHCQKYTGRRKEKQNVNISSIKAKAGLESRQSVKPRKGITPLIKYQVYQNQENRIISQNC